MIEKLKITKLKIEKFKTSNLKNTYSDNSKILMVICSENLKFRELQIMENDILTEIWAFKNTNIMKTPEFRKSEF
jgi:hypothetical protein